MKTIYISEDNFCPNCHNNTFFCRIGNSRKCINKKYGIDLLSTRYIYTCEKCNTKWYHQITKNVLSYPYNTPKEIVDKVKKEVEI